MTKYTGQISCSEHTAVAQVKMKYICGVGLSLLRNSFNCAISGNHAIPLFPLI